MQVDGMTLRWHLKPAVECGRHAQPEHCHLLMGVPPANALQQASSSIWRGVELQGCQAICCQGVASSLYSVTRN
jgi:hypothetical protein